VSECRALFQEIRRLLAAPEGGEEVRAVAHLEDTLTSGYAHALAVEAERMRLERRLGDAARQLGSNGAAAGEIASLAERINAADSDLTSMRGLLAALRERVSAARAAA
jgi:hypothetical protein